MKLYYKTSISSAHKLSLPYESKCKKLHGHNYKIELLIDGSINEHGMLIDFSHLKREVQKYDHINLNNIITQPTVENLTQFLLGKLKNLSKTENINSIKIKIWETENAFVEDYWTKENR